MTDRNLTTTLTVDQDVGVAMALDGDTSAGRPVTPLCGVGSAAGPRVRR